MDFVPRRPFADPAGAKLIVFLAPRFPARYLAQIVTMSATFCFLSCNILRTQSRPEFHIRQSPPLIARPKFSPFFRL